jgi:sugar phosphate isomerase/epimerase
MPGDSYVERFTKLRDIGFTATEVNGSLLWHDFDEINEASRSADLPVAAVCLGYEGSLLDEDPIERQKAADDLKKILAMCNDLGGAHVVVPPIFGEPRVPDLTPFMTSIEIEDAVIVPLLREIVDDRPDDASRILLEPLNRYEQHYLRTLADAVRVVSLTDRARVRVIADVFHMNIEELDPYRALREAIDYVSHIHLADNTRLEPGTGTIDFARYGAVLRDANYTGACSLECDLSGEAYMALKKSSRYLSEMLIGSE